MTEAGGWASWCRDTICGNDLRWRRNGATGPACRSKMMLPCSSVPTLCLLGTTMLRMVAIGSEQRFRARRFALKAGDDADAGMLFSAARSTRTVPALKLSRPGRVDRRTRAGGGDEAPSRRPRWKILGDPRRAQPVSARAGSDPPRRAGCAMNSPTAQPGRQRHFDRGLKIEYLTLIVVPGTPGHTPRLLRDLAAASTRPGNDGGHKPHLQSL